MTFVHAGAADPRTAVNLCSIFAMSLDAKKVATIAATTLGAGAVAYGIYYVVTKRSNVTAEKVALVPVKASIEKSWFFLFFDAGDFRLHLLTDTSPFYPLQSTLPSWKRRRRSTAITTATLRYDAALTTL